MHTTWSLGLRGVFSSRNLMEHHAHPTLETTVLNNMRTSQTWRRDSSVSLVTWLRAGRAEFGSLENTSFRHNIQTGSGVHPASCPLSTWDLSSGSTADAKPVIHNRLVKRLRMHGAIPPLLIRKHCLVLSQAERTSLRLLTNHRYFVDTLVFIWITAI
jgi:hypothetical protein